MKTIHIGKDSKNDWVFNANTVSQKHARLEVQENGSVKVTDLNSTNGTFVNGQRINQTILKSGDVLKVSRFAVNWEQFFHSEKSNTEQTISIGRGSHNNIVLNDRTVTGSHAKLIVSTDGKVEVVDLNSTNGTFVNGKRVTRKNLNDGDVLKVSSTIVDWKPHSAQNTYIHQQIVNTFKKKEQKGLLKFFSILIGLDNKFAVSFNDLFSEVSKSHSKSDMDEIFSRGLSDSKNVSNTKPWFFARMFLFGGILAAILWLSLVVFENLLLIPGFIVVGSFIIPFATIIFLYELSPQRDVPFYQIIKMFFIGGGISIPIALLIFVFSNNFGLDDMFGASVAAFVEEPAKLVALAFFYPRKYYKESLLRGLIFGATVGAGFAAFESAGYAFNALISGSSLEGSIILRGILSPFCHIIWTGMVGAAFFHVKNNETFTLSLLGKKVFIRTLFIAVLLHFTWNSGLVGLVGLLILGVIGWIVIWALYNEGIKKYLV